MAAGTLPKPGKKLGPCKNDCKHKDCQAVKKMAASLCRFCNKEIGYETRFYRDSDGALTHAVCEEMAADKARIMITGKDFTVADGLNAQTQQVQQWAKVLKPEVVQQLNDWLAQRNANLPPDACGFDVTRGTDLDAFIQNMILEQYVGQLISEMP